MQAFCSCWWSQTITAIINHIALAVHRPAYSMDENTAGALHQHNKIAFCVETSVCYIFIEGCEVNGWLSTILCRYIWPVMTE